jgi:dipeptidyl aminopeptidase/acylaminoacyl peptidase
VYKQFSDTILVELNRENPKYFDVYSLNLNSGALILVAKNTGNVRTWLEDSKLQVRAAITTGEGGKQSLVVRPDQNSPFKTLLNFDFEDGISDEIYCGLLGFSENGKFIYLNTSLNSNTRKLIKIEIATGRQEILASDESYDLSGVYFNTDTHEPMGVIWQKERLVHKILDASFEKVFNQMTALSSGILDSLQSNDDRSAWIVGFLHDNKSYEFYYFDSKKNKSTFLFYTRPQLKLYELAPMEAISYQSRDGLTIHGYLTRPVNSNKKLPLVLYVHGGPFTRDAWGYNSVALWLANRGYACLQVNYRGSSGYGKDFLAAGNREWGNKMQNDLSDAVQWAIQKGIADPKRVAIFGASYGGYAALAGAAFTPDVFACAIDFFGPSNLVTLLNSFPSYWPIEPWEKRIGPKSDEEFLKLRSPLFKADQIKIPLFVAHGAHDVRVTLAESEQLIRVLEKRGIAHKYLVFEDEGHGVFRAKNRMLLYKELEAFLAQHLGL